MGQITSIFDPDERRNVGELDEINEDDEYNESFDHSPREDEDSVGDDTSFEDCVALTKIKITSRLKRVATEKALKKNDRRGL